ncbi:MAG: acyl-CoA thioesterase [Ardenticatenaceae bacterium]
MEELLKEYPVVVEIPVVWGEMDAFGHVNSVVYFRYFENARRAYFERVKIPEYRQKTGIGTILAWTECKFNIPLTSPDTVSVGVKVSEISEDRFRMAYGVVSHKLQKMVAEGESITVSYNYKEKKKTPLPVELKRRILEVETRD